MNSNNAVQQKNELVNGVDLDQVMKVIANIESDSSYAKFQWQATNNWIDDGLSRSRIKDFFAGNSKDKLRTQTFILDADEPVIVAGQDSAPNSMEYVLPALGTCLTGTLVYHAAVRGIEIEAVESSYAGDMDLRGLFGLENDVPKGFNKVKVSMRVKSEASVDELTELAMYSPVYEIISNSLPVEFCLTTF
jgi:uncharacterized OsmC-like protein